MTPSVRPWLARADWREGVIHSRGAGRPSGRVASAIFVATLIVGAIAFINSSGFVAFVIALMIAADFIFIATVGDKLQRDVEFGPSTFTFEQIPFLLGGRLKGVIHMNFRDIDEETRLMFSCSSDWRHVHVLLAGQVHRDGNNASIDVDFGIPDDEPPTRHGGNRVIWELSVLKGFPTGRRMAAFEVPVFPRAAEGMVEETAVAREGKSEVRKALSVFDD